MAIFQNKEYLEQQTHQAFNQLHPPGSVSVHSGIYRCENCGDEIAANKDNPLPPQNHRQHSPLNGPIKWRLIVAAVTS